MKRLFLLLLAVPSLAFASSPTVLYNQWATTSMIVQCAPMNELKSTLMGGNFKDEPVVIGLSGSNRPYGENVKLAFFVNNATKKWMAIRYGEIKDIGCVVGVGNNFEL